MLNTSSNLSIVIVVFDTSIKNNVTISIAHIHSFSNPLKKTLYHAINVISTEAELFAIRCGILGYLVFLVSLLLLILSMQCKEISIQLYIHIKFK